MLVSSNPDVQMEDIAKIMRQTFHHYIQLNMMKIYDIYVNITEYLV